MMKCGHAANATDPSGNPGCAICIGLGRGADEVDSAPPDLTGRTVIPRLNLTAFLCDCLFCLHLSGPTACPASTDHFAAELSVHRLSADTAERISGHLHVHTIAFFVLTLT